MTVRPTALTSCEQSNRDFAETFIYQFILSQEASLDTPGWQEKACNGWTLRHSEKLDTAPLTDANGKPVGFLLGIAVDANGKSLHKGVKFRLAATDPGFIDAVEETITGCAGRYLFAVLTPEFQSVYTDPVADLGMVYDPTTRIVASSLMLALRDDILPNEVVPFDDIRSGAQFYTLGHTRDQRVKRMLANFYLDLRTFTTARFWPRPDTDLEVRQDTPVETTDLIIERLRAVFCEILRTQTCMVPLSGGRDSRCLIGVGSAEIHRARTLFTWRFHRQSGLDSETAKVIARRLDLPHEEYLFQKLTMRSKQTYLLRNGYAIYGTALRSLGIMETLPEGHVLPRGNIMGILRATNWTGQSEGPLNLTHAIRRLRLGEASGAAHSTTDRWTHEFMMWYQTLPEVGRSKVYDLLWTDIVLPHNQGAREYGVPNNFIVNPYNDRRLLQLSMQLPLAFRRRDKAYDQIAERTVPHLSDIPYI
ncbi:hypothetical protein [Litoreibacter roseus]|uniref:Asparagine synthase n=1 Tax=Litoreibacter roseus TaxID=2601869 RepID=A0A6N6JAK8_9RHOB|nr:hypothetical protein [Litoreibacter roseus]GFE63225.1 hypothetical protein KIN_02990 [Litoreibacter roseus]